MINDRTEYYIRNIICHICMYECWRCCRAAVPSNLYTAPGCRECAGGREDGVLEGEREGGKAESVQGMRNKCTIGIRLCMHTYVL